MEYTGASSWDPPLRNMSSMIKRYSTVFPPCFAMSSPAALAEPPSRMSEERPSGGDEGTNLSQSGRRRQRRSVRALSHPPASRTSPKDSRSFICIAHRKKLRLTVPYSFSYEAETHSPGSLPCLRTGTKAAPSLSAIIGPRRKPRASRPTTTSIFLLGAAAMVCEVR